MEVAEGAGRCEAYKSGSSLAYSTPTKGLYMTSIVRGGKTSSFEKKNGIVYRVYHDLAGGGATTRQVVLPESLRKYVMSIAHDTITDCHRGLGRPGRRS